MHSDTTSWRNGQVTERYGELIDSSHETILRLAKRFRIGLWDVLAAQPRRSTDTFYFSGQYYPVQEATTNFKPVYRALKKDLREAGYPTEWNDRVTLDTPATNPFLLGSYSYWRVGQYTLFAGVEKEASGHCHFAGEHCSTDFQGFMEGAAAEGARAAGEIIDAI